MTNFIRLVRIIQNENGQNLTPTCIAAPGYHELNSAPVVFGLIAQTVAKKGCPDVVTDLVRFTRNPKKLMQWHLFDDQDTVKISPTVVLAIFLAYIRHNAQRTLQQSSIKKALIAIPSSFTDVQRQTYVDAAKIAGFTQVRLHSKVALGMLNYLASSPNVEEIYQNDGYCFIFRFGGGFLEAAIAKVRRGGIDFIANVGSHHFGGCDITDKFLEACLVKIENESSVEGLREDHAFLADLRKECDKKKVTLSATNVVTFPIDISDGPSFKIEFHRQELEELIVEVDKMIPEMFDWLFDTVKQKFHIESSQVGHVYMMGGSCGIPRVQKIINDYFKNRAYVHISSVDDHFIVKGAAIAAAFLSNEQTESINKTELNEVTGFSIGKGPGEDGNKPIIDCTDKIPLLKDVGEIALDSHLKYDQTCSFGDYEVNEEVGFAQSQSKKPTNVALSLRIGNNGTFQPISTPEIKWRKRHAYSKAKVEQSQDLIIRLQAETERRRSIVDSKNSLRNFVRQVSRQEQEEPHLLGEDFIA